MKKKTRRVYRYVTSYFPARQITFLICHTWKIGAVGIQKEKKKEEEEKKTSVKDFSDKIPLFALCIWLSLSGLGRETKKHTLSVEDENQNQNASVYVYSLHSCIMKKDFSLLFFHQHGSQGRRSPRFARLFLSIP